ncbi:MAG: FGGY family carbohydrate kinase [Lachnospiraceae bacterium]
MKNEKRTYAAGIDIGTTTICGLVIDSASGEVISRRTIQNDSALSGMSEEEQLQEPEKIIEVVFALYRSFIETYETIVSVGLTGQMHGIVYTDKNGRAVSPLYTWQDERGNRSYRNGKTYAEYLTEATGNNMATGFGLTTHFYQLVNGEVPEEAVSFCTIQDYAVMRLTGRKRPLLGMTDAASFGCFDLRKLCFEREKLEAAGIDTAILPEICANYEIAGYTEQKIPVSVAIGDNQASVIGSVKDIAHTVLINIGTGSQVSAGTETYADCSGIELRPCTKESYIFVGSGLCGGRAYAALEQFFRKTVAMGTRIVPESLYEKMGELLKEKKLSTEPDNRKRLTVDTRFSGTRQEPERRGSITGLSLSNFTPEALMDGVLSGIVEELYAYYEQMCAYKGQWAIYLVGSGNGVRSNPYLRELLEKRFGIEMLIPKHREEAAYGAALFSLAAAGIYPSLQEAQGIIQYL